MKKYLSIALCIILLTVSGTIFAGQLRPYAFPFIGRWQPSEDPALIDEYGFQDIQNLRRHGKRLRGVKGQTKINTAVMDTTYKYPHVGFHFKKERPRESHVLVSAYDVNLTTNRIWDNTTPIPNQGNFSATSLHTDTTGAGVGRFSPAPNGQLLYCNGKESMIWGGNETPCATFIGSTAAITNSVTNARDRTAAVTNTVTTKYAKIDASDYKYFIVGSTRPLQGVKFYLETVNGSSATLTAEEWNGTAWAGLTETDNTNGLAQNGTVTWPSTVSTSKQKHLEGFLFYWYQFTLSAGSANVYYVTVDAPWQAVVDIWDGSPVSPMQFQVYDGTTWHDYSLEVKVEASTDFETAPAAADLDNLAAANYLYIGFPVRITGIYWNMTSETNANAATVTIYYWDGDSWVSVGTVTDSTLVGGAALASSGYTSWTDPGEDTEMARNMFDLVGRHEIFAITGRDLGNYERYLQYAWSGIGVNYGQAPPGYYYKVTWSGALDASVLVDTVGGVLAPATIKPHKFPMMFQGRPFLCSESDGDKNKCMYGMFLASDVWNGTDSGVLYFGDNSELTAGCTLYNVYRTTALEQAIITKANETYRVFGDSPETWRVQQMSSNVGCVAPLSMVVCEVADISEDLKRNVVIWQAGHGFVMTDGATIQMISGDIDVYFDEDDTRYIEPKKIDDTVGWYDPNTHTYHALISSGSDFEIADTWGDSDTWQAAPTDLFGLDWALSLVTHNVELEYSLQYAEWTKIYRENGSGANPLQVGFPVKDNYGNVFTYGATDEGYMYRLENGQDWDGTSIDQYVETKDLLLHSDPNQPMPLFKETTVEFLRLLFEDKTTTDTTDIAISHKCDRVETTDGSNDQDEPDAFDMDNGPFEGVDCYLGPCLMHSFKIRADNITDCNDGMELIGLGLLYDSDDMVED